MTDPDPRFVELSDQRLRGMVTRMIYSRNDNYQSAGACRQQVDAVLDAMISLGCRSAACVQGRGDTGTGGARPHLLTTVQMRSAGPCPCECNSGGFCGGCGHAGCGGRRAR